MNGSRWKIAPHFWRSIDTRVSPALLTHVTTTVSFFWGGGISFKCIPEVNLPSPETVSANSNYFDDARILYRTDDGDIIAKPIKVILRIFSNFNF